MVDATTDDRGQWRCRCFREHDVRISLLVASRLSQRRRSPSARAWESSAGYSAQLGITNRWHGLRDFSDVQVMTTGVSLAGK